jgi:hypothetical protein
MEKHPVETSSPEAELPFRESRLITARLLHDILRLGHSSLPDLPFMQAVEILMITTSIFIAETEGTPLNASTLSRHLGMPRPTLFRRLSFLASKGMVRRHGGPHGGLQLNPQMFRTEVRDRDIRRLRQLIIDAGVALSKTDT